MTIYKVRIKEKEGHSNNLLYKAAHVHEALEQVTSRKAKKYPFP
jgi:hypothetical protein